MERLIGYVAHNTTLGLSASRTVRLRNVTDATIRALIGENLDALERILNWNIEYGILLYRITSNLIPYASHPVNRIDWASEYSERFDRIGGVIRKNNMIVSMHPGQYTLLSSPDDDITSLSIAEIEYHSTVLDLLGLGTESKVIIHLGGAYGDKTEAMQRWISNWRRLSEQTRGRIVIENDERTYKVSDCMAVHRETGLPCVFDTLHYRLNPDDSVPYREPLVRCLSTWPSTLTPEVHFSAQGAGRPGTHSRTIDVRKFRRFWRETEDLRFNIMLETKDKEKSVLKLYKALGAGLHPH